jgi:hypothetical protein
VPELVLVPRAKMNGRLSIKVGDIIRSYIEKFLIPSKKIYVKKALLSETVVFHLMYRSFLSNGQILKQPQSTLTCNASMDLKGR